MSLRRMLSLWCMGLGIDPVVLEHPDMAPAIERQDGLAAFEVLRRNAQPLPGQKMETLDDGYQLEFMCFVSGNTAGAALAAALAGRLL